MTPREIELVKASYAKLLPQPERFTALLYDHLFAMKPELIRYFAPPRIRQELRVAMMLSTIVNGLDRFDSLRPAIVALGQRHQARGITAEDYEIFGEALLRALKARLGRALTAEAHAAWQSLYWEVADLMQLGEDEAELAAVMDGDDTI